MQLAESKRKFSLPFHVVKRLDTPRKQYWLIKCTGFLVALLLAGLICTILTPGSFGLFYKEMFLGVFDPSDSDILLELLETAGLLLLVAFALAPAFKMKFWNLGGEGQILIGCLVTAGICKFMNASDGVLIIVSLLAAVASGIIWAVIPAIFKAFFNTNETLFTLMMNYVAIALIALCINIWVPSGSQVFGVLINGELPDFGVKYLLNLIIIAVVVALMIVYLKKTKHGYELSVVGESVNTARYVGINVKKVIIRTMILSGALCGLVGFLLVAGHHHTLSTGLADGRGFTGVLVAWLGGFNPGQMILYAFLVAIFQCGSRHAASYMGMSSIEFSAIVTGVFFLVVIASEFFVNYRVMKKGKELVAKTTNSQALTVPSYEVKEEDKKEEVAPIVKEEEKKPAPTKKAEEKKEVKPAKKEEAPKKAEPKKAEPKKAPSKKVETKPAKKEEPKKVEVKPAKKEQKTSNSPKKPVQKVENKKEKVAPKAAPNKTNKKSGKEGK